MPGPLARAAHHLYRYFAGFLLILFILWGGWHVKGQLADLNDNESLHQYLLDKGAELSKDISAAKEEAVKSAENWKKTTNDELARQISQLSVEIEQKTSKVLALDSIANAINPSRQLEIARLNAEITLATQKRDYLLRIKEYRLGQSECGRKNNQCETIRQRHVLDYRSYLNTTAQLAPLQESWQAQYNALSQEYSLRTNLEERRDALALKTQGHKAEYAQCLASAQKDCTRKEPPPFALNSAAIDQAQANLQQITQKLGDELTRHWLKSAVLDPIRAVLPMAIQVFIAALLGKLGIKFLLYFVLAPRAAHGRAICLVSSLKIAAHSGASLTQLLSGDLSQWVCPQIEPQLVLNLPQPKPRTRTVKRERNWEEIENQLQEFLVLPTPITVREVGRRLNIDARLLYLRANTLTRQLGQRWKEYLRRRQDEHVVNAWPYLEQACIDIWEEGKAVTLREVIARVPAPILAPLSNLILNLKDVQSHLMRPDFESEAAK